MDKEEIGNIIEDYLKPRMELTRSPYIYHASESWKCPKRLVLKRLFPKEPEREKWGLFKVGTLFHRAVEDYFEWRDDYKVETEERWVDEVDGIRVVCHPDIVHFDNGAPDSISEIKTTKYLSYVEEGARDHHRVQLQTYLNVVPTGEGFLVYIRKSDFSYKIYRVQRDRRVYKAVLRKFRRVRDYLEEGEIPDEPKYDPSDWRCEYCPFRKACRMGSEVIRKLIREGKNI